MNNDDFISFDNDDIDWDTILEEEREEEVDDVPHITLKTIFKCHVCEKDFFFDAASFFRP